MGRGDNSKVIQYLGVPSFEVIADCCAQVVQSTRVVARVNSAHGDAGNQAAEDGEFFRPHVSVDEVRSIGIGH